MLRRSVFFSFFVLSACSNGCSTSAEVPPGDVPVDSGESDTAIEDSTTDTSVTDTGTPPDGSTDTTTGDTATADSATTDTASTADTGSSSDTAVADSGSDSPLDSGSSTDASDAGTSCAPTPAPVVTKTGVANKILLQGTVVTPDTFFVGEVLVEGDLITCAAASCAASPGAATATVVQTNGIIFPGMIDTHNHILFDIFDETDWSPTKAYGNHNQWTAEARYSAMVDAKQYMNGEAGSTWNYGCEMDKFGELKALVAGTTSVAGAANPANRACYGSLARTIDQTPNDLGVDKLQVATLFPTKATADGVCANFTSGKTDAYLIHIAEGVDSTALGEFAKLGSVTTTPNCLYNQKTTIVHGTALGDTELTTMATNNMKLTWSPRSNVFLYGAGTDLTKTTNVPLAITKGINVAIAPDWSMGGSQNMLDELRFADKVDNTAWGDKLTPKMLVQMATINAAKNAGLDALIGSIAVGKKADLFVIGGDATKPYDALLASTPRDVRMVMVGGVTLYGDSALKSIAPATPGCETIDVCCASKFVCVAESGGTATDKLGQTYSDITTALTKALTDYDALAITSYKFAPLTPLVRCP